MPRLRPSPSVVAQVLAVLAMVLVAAPLSAQRSATATAVVQIPTVSELDVESATADPVVLTANGAESSGMFRIRVRANHPWKILLSNRAQVDQTLWVRAVAASGEGEYERLNPGSEKIVLSGDPGQTVVEVEYRWVSESPDLAPALPLTYTLASL